MAGAALGLDPAADAARAIGRVELLGDDAFEAHAAGRFQHRIARRLEMLDIAQRRMLALEPVQQLLQPRLALAERQRRADPRRRRTADRRRRRSGRRTCPPTSAACRAAKSGAPCVSSATASPSIMQSGRLLGLLGDGGELLRPVQPLARAQRRLAVLDAQLQAIAVELDLVRPAGVRRAAARPAWRAAARRSRGIAETLRGLGLGRARRRPSRRRPSCCSPRPRRPRASCRS